MMPWEFESGELGAPKPLGSGTVIFDGREYFLSDSMKHYRAVRGKLGP
jgi:hypothetical protein